MTTCREYSTRMNRQFSVCAEDNSMTASLLAIEQDVKKKDIRIARLHEALAEAESTNLRLHATHSRLDSDYQTRMVNLQGDLDRLRASFESQIHHLDVALEHERTDCATRDSRIHCLEIENHRLNDQVSAASEELTSLAARLESMNEHRTTMSEELSYTTKRAEFFQKRSETLNELLHLATEKERTSAQEAEHLKCELETIVHRSNELEAELRKIKAEFLRSISEVDEAVERQSAEHKTVLASLENELNESRTGNNLLKYEKLIILTYLLGLK